MGKKTLSHYKNKNVSDTVLIFDNIKTAVGLRYRFAISMSGHKGKISITVSQKIHSDDDQKTNEVKFIFVVIILIYDIWMRFF